MKPSIGLHAALAILWATLGSMMSALAQPPITQITNHPNNQTYPAIYGDRIVWEDYRDNDWNIYMYTISTASETVICSVPGEQRSPRIWGDRVVWQDYRDGNWDIYLYDLSTSTETQITSLTSSQKSPDIWGDRVVWQDYRDGNWDIYMYDLVSQTEVPICTVAVATPFNSDQINPAISEFYVVWEDYRFGNADIFLYNLLTQEERPVTSSYSEQTRPSIDHQIVTWTDDRYSTDTDIYVCQLNPSWPIGNDRIWNITRWLVDQYLMTPANQRNSHIQGDYVVFEDDRSGNWDLYMFVFRSFTNGYIVPVCDYPADQTEPRVHGEYVTWMDNTNITKNIFMWERPPGADLGLTMADEPDPLPVGDYLLYHLNLINHGPASASGVILRDTIPASADFYAASLTQGTFQIDGNVITAEIGTLDAYSAVNMSITVRPTTAGNIYNRASVFCNEVDPIAENNRAFVGTEVTGIPTSNLSDGLHPTITTGATGHAYLAFPEEEYSAWSPGPWYSRVRPGKMRYADNTIGLWVKEWVSPLLIYYFPGIGNPPVYEDRVLSTSIDLDSEGDVHVWFLVCHTHYSTFGTIVDQKYRILHRDKVNGGWTAVDTLLSTDLQLEGMTATLDSNDKSHIAYIQGNMWSGALMYMTNKGGAWVTEQVHPIVYNSIALAVDGNGDAHVNFYSWDIVPGYTYQGVGYCTNAPSGTWQTPEPVEPNWTGGQMEGMVLDIAVDAANRPHMSYLSGGGVPQEDYRYAYKDGGVWHTSLVDSGGFGGHWNRLALGPDTSVHIIYVHPPSWNLRYANNRSGGWQVETIRPQVSVWGTEPDIAVDVFGDVHICFVEDEEIIYIKKSNRVDGDNDGMPDDEEWGPAGNDPNYDGNGDGIPDWQQRHVASFRTFNQNYYVTLSVGDTSLALSDVQAVSIPAPNEPGAPSPADCPYGFFKFDIVGLDIGQAVTVQLFLHGGPPMQTYYKYGPTPGQNTHWYQFLHDGQTGAVFSPDVVTLYFVDGLRGDFDVTANGRIIEPGGPGYPPSAIDDPSGMPVVQFQLYQNFPNPFNASTMIRYALPATANVEVAIYNVLGQRVRSWEFNRQAAGVHQIWWDGHNTHHQAVASGIYLLRIKAGEWVEQRKMIMIR